MLTPDNEVKLFGSFDVYSSTRKIKRVRDKLTLKMTDDFRMRQMDCCQGTMAFVSEQGSALLWPFFNPAKKTIARVRLTLPSKIKEVRCGSDFVVMRNANGQVFSMGHSNSCGELGFGLIGFPPGQLEQKLREVRIFREHGERVVRLAAGMKHVLALTQRNRVFAWGANFRGQLGQGDKFNSSLPRLVVLSENISYNAKVLWIECGKFSSYVLLRNNVIYEFGSNGRMVCQRKPKLLDIGFASPFVKSPNEFHVFRIKSSWSKSMELTYLQIGRVGENFRVNQDKVLFEKTVKRWLATNVLPSPHDLEVVDNEVRWKTLSDKNDELAKKVRLMFHDEFREEQEHDRNAILLEIDSIDSKREICVLENQLLTFEKVLENWEVWETKYKQLKMQIEDGPQTTAGRLSEDERQFVSFFNNIKRVLMG